MYNLQFIRSLKLVKFLLIILSLVFLISCSDEEPRTSQDSGSDVGADVFNGSDTSDSGMNIEIPSEDVLLPVDPSGEYDIRYSDTTEITSKYFIDGQVVTKLANINTDYLLFLSGTTAEESERRWEVEYDEATSELSLYNLDLETGERGTPETYALDLETKSGSFTSPAENFNFNENCIVEFRQKFEFFIGDDGKLATAAIKSSEKYISLNNYSSPDLTCEEIFINFKSAIQTSTTTDTPASIFLGVISGALDLRNLEKIEELEFNVVFEATHTSNKNNSRISMLQLKSPVYSKKLLELISKF